MLKIILIVLITSLVMANQPPCEIWNYDTEQCETFAEQNLTVKPDWQEFYTDEPLDGQLMKIKD